MASDTAKAVAQEVVQNIRNPKGKIKSKREILARHGYAPSVQNAPTVVTETQSYKSVVIPFVERMVQERDAVIERMKATRDKAKYRDLVDSMDKLTKNIQLLTGGTTQNVLIGVKKLSDDELQKLAGD